MTTTVQGSITTGSTVTPVVVDIEATVAAEVAKLVAAAKSEESKIVTWVKTTISTYWPHVAAAVAGYAASAYGVVKILAKLF